MTAMFKGIEPLKKMSKEEFGKLYPPLRERLGELQRELWVKGLPVIVVFEG